MLIFLNLLGRAQEIYDNCSSAIEICPGQTISLNNLGANSISCVNCEDDFTFCFTSDNSIWCTFTTNTTGGNVQIDFSNLVFEAGANQDNELQAAVIEMASPCDASTYTQIGSCHSNETGNFILTATALNPNATYYVVIDGDNNGAGITSPAECTFDLTISGPGVDRPASSISIAESSSSICANEIITFTSTITDCPDNGEYSWYINGTLAATTTDPFFQTTAIQDGDSVTVETSCYLLCAVIVTATSVPISVYTVFVDAGIDVWVDAGTTFSLNGTTSAPIYYWSPSFLVSNPNVLDPIVSPTSTTVFSLTAEENGCVATDYVTVTITSELEIPNTFSPNGDNNNDTWIIKGIEMYPDNQISIFSRWGQKVFRTSAYSEIKAWDGGNEPEGVYYFVLDLNDGSDEPIRGTITLLR